MSLSQQKAWCLVSIVLLLICLASVSGLFLGSGAQLPTIAHAAERQNQLQTGSNEKLRALLMERYDVLKTLAENLNQQLGQGRAGISEVRNATIAMFYAEADLCATDSERVKVYEKVVATLREQEESTARQVDAGWLPRIEVLRAKAARLEAQIGLEKQKLAQETSR